MLRRCGLAAALCAAGGAALPAAAAEAAAAAAAGGGGGGGLMGDVTLTKATASFHHAYYELYSNNTMKTYDPSKLVDTVYESLLVENSLIRVTIVPGFGGRIMSIIYKPTGHEMLYQNSCGSAYCIHAGGFYYDWLMIWGGIFPTLSEPEHGKAWLLPFQSEVITNSPDEVAVQMSFTDSIDIQGHPAKFDVGKTGLKLQGVVRVLRGSAAVHFELSLENPKDEAVTYEYWTCTTLAPGSQPGSPRAPLNSEIISPTPLISVPAPYDSLARNEETLVGESGDHGNIYEFDRLRTFSNWDVAASQINTSCGAAGPGAILYAEPRVAADYWGTINHDEEVGMFRVADRTVTPGMKMWTFGRDSVKSDPQKPIPERPYIELWGGHSTQFFNRTHIGARSAKVWNETYLPTVGLAEISSMNAAVAAHLRHAAANFTVDLFTSEFSTPFSVALLSRTSGAEVELGSHRWTADPKGPTRFSAEAPGGARELGVTVRRGGDVVFASWITAA